MIKLDKWQLEYEQEKGDKLLVSGRQTGKSEAAAYDNAMHAITNPNHTCLIISKTERQAQELLLKSLNFLHDLEEEHYKKYIALGANKPTLSKINLRNGSRIISLPTGMAGEGIRYLTAHKITADEAQLIPSDVYAAVTPMLLTTGGKLSLLGTPQGKTGYFWDAYVNRYNQFKIFHINTKEVIENRPISKTWQEWQRTAALEHIAREKDRMSAKQFAQEYLGQFVDDLNNYFSEELIKKICILKRPEHPRKERNYMGVDIARMGRDLSVFSILHIYENSIHQYENITKKKRYTTETEDDIIQLAKSWNLDKIGIDAGSGSLGVGIYDRLMTNSEMKRKVIPMNNRSISTDRFAKSRQRIFKEDMYDNLRAMMERREILLLDDDEIIASLKSVQYEYIDDSRISRMKIFGSYTHTAEALIRAAWLAKKEKLFKLSISYL